MTVNPEDYPERGADDAEAAVANEMTEHFARELKDYERDGTWDMERVVLERMRGNSAARPAPAKRLTTRGA